jgi:hypothetical protein
LAAGQEQVSTVDIDATRAILKSMTMKRIQEMTEVGYVRKSVCHKLDHRLMRSDRNRFAAFVSLRL